MTPDEGPTNRLRNALLECSQDLSARTAGCAPLRKCQRTLRQILENDSDPYITAISFILDKWVHDYYFNFAGDILSTAAKEVDEVREGFLLESVARSLGKMAEKIDDQSLDVYADLQELIFQYIHAIREAVALVGDW